MTEPLSPRNPRVKRLGRLARKRSARAEQAAYVIEGFTLVAEALSLGVALEAVYVEAGAPASAIDPLVEAARARTVEVVVVARGGLTGVVDAVSPQPVAAVGALPVASLDRVCSSGDFVVVLVGVADPGNAGTVLRSAEAAGAGGVICSTGVVDPFSPKCVRASAGAVFRLPVVTDVAPEDALIALASAGFTRLGTSVASGVPYDSVDLSGPVALVLGNEARGLDGLLGSVGAGLIDVEVTIPMQPGTESLNVAMAAAVLCFEVARQRRAGLANDLPSIGADGTVRRP